MSILAVTEFAASKVEAGERRQSLWEAGGSEDPDLLLPISDERDDEEKGVESKGEKHVPFVDWRSCFRGVFKMSQFHFQIS